VFLLHIVLENLVMGQIKEAHNRRKEIELWDYPQQINTNHKLPQFLVDDFQNWLGWMILVSSRWKREPTISLQLRVGIKTFFSVEVDFPFGLT